jgi:periplasmic protein TonB
VITEAIPETFGSKLPPVNDRLMTTLFLAALFHAIIILGISFSAPPSDRSKDAAPMLEVVLVNERTPALKKNPHARYLSQRNQKGAGNMRGRERARIPKSSPLPMQQAGMADAEGSQVRAAAGTSGEDQLIASHAPAFNIKYFATPEAVQSKPEVPELMENKADLGLPATDEESVLQLQGDNAQHALWVTADTQESTVAVYLDAWRRKVERIGTINFPTVARDVQLSGTPVVEVAISADGKLAAAAIRHSSGSAEIDQAALAILKLASPFDPFPHDLSQEHDELRFAYEWQFLGGQSASSSVLLGVPSK